MRLRSFLRPLSRKRLLTYRRRFPPVLAIFILPLGAGGEFRSRIAQVPDGASVNFGLPGYDPTDPARLFGNLDTGRRNQ